jgi:hypothetical protein
MDILSDNGSIQIYGGKDMGYLLRVALTLFFICTSLVLVWYWLVPQNLQLEYIGYQEALVTWTDWWQQYEHVSDSMLTLRELGVLEIDNIKIDNAGNYLVVSSNRRIKSITYSRISRFLWSYRDVYQGKVVYEDEEHPTRVFFYKTPRIRVANIG